MWSCFAQDFDALFIEVSAKDGSNVLEAATEFARLLRSNEDLEVQSVSLRLRESINNKKTNQSGKCCS